MDEKSKEQVTVTFPVDISNGWPSAPRLVGDVLDELISSTRKFGPMYSAHEGYAILLEEVDELWDEIKVNDSRRNMAKMRKEAIQVAAMAMRFVHDVCDSPVPRSPRS